jgi:hypothetical protein
MPSSKKPRKPMSRRKYVHTNPFDSVISKLNPDDTRNLKLIPHQCLAELRMGRGSEEVWNTLACRVNWSGVLACNIEFEQDLRPAIREALDALRAIEARFKEINRWIASGDELKAIGEALTIADEIQDVTTRRDHRDAFVTVMAVAT